MKKALISSISTPKPMESKSIIILRLFGTLPVLLRQNSQKSWWQILPVKKPLAWLCLITIIVSRGWEQMSISKFSTLRETFPWHIFGSLWSPEEFYWEQLRQNENRAIRAIMGRNSSRDFRNKVCCVRWKKKFEMWTNMAMWPTINNSKPTKKLQVGFVWCVNLCGVWTWLKTSVGQPQKCEYSLCFPE